MKATTPVMKGSVKDPPRTLKPSWLFISAPRITDSDTPSIETGGGSAGPMAFGTAKGRLTKVQAKAARRPTTSRSAIRTFMRS